MVSNLSCANLTRNNVLQSLQADAFSVTRFWRTENWESGFLGNCWGLSLTEREALYYLRFAVVDAPDLTQSGNLEQILDMLGGQSKYKNRVVAIKDSNIITYDKKQAANTLIEEGINGKNFKNQIEQRQKDRFFKIQNKNLVFNKPTAIEKKEIFEKILSNSAQGRISLLVLRFSLTNQHVVLILSVELKDPINKTYTLHLYDSNQPTSPATMEYKNGEYDASNVLLHLGNKNIEYLDVFLEDESEMDEIQNNLYFYYANLCNH